MPIEFDIKLQPKDMYRFKMYQTYSGFHGIMSIVIAIFVLSQQFLHVERLRQHTPYYMYVLEFFFLFICQLRYGCARNMPLQHRRF